MARLRDPDERVVVLPVVLGITNVGVLATEIWVTAGLRAWRPANVSRALITVFVCLLLSIYSDFHRIVTFVVLYLRAFD